jgi:hypothetical protein
MLPGLKPRGFSRSFHASNLPHRSEKVDSCVGSLRLICQTRSGTRNTHASGQDLPLIRAFFDSLVCCPQARLRTFPGNDVLGTRGNGICWIKKGC